MTAGQREVTISAEALREGGVRPTAFPVTLRAGNTLRLGVNVQRYLADEFGLGDGPLPEPLPHAAQVALSQALPHAEASNIAAGKSGKNAIVFTADLAKALGHDPAAMERRYKTSASRLPR